MIEQRERAVHPIKPVDPRASSAKGTPLQLAAGLVMTLASEISGLESELATAREDLRSLERTLEEVALALGVDTDKDHDLVKSVRELRKKAQDPERAAPASMHVVRLALERRKKLRSIAGRLELLAAQHNAAGNQTNANVLLAIAKEATTEEETS